MSSNSSFYAVKFFLLIIKLNKLKIFCIQRILDSYEPQLSVLQEQAHSLNEQLLNSFTPLQLIAITSLATAFGIGFYRFLFGHDEG